MKYLHINIDDICSTTVLMVKLNIYSDSLDVKLISLRRRSSSSETSSPGQSPSTLQEGSCSSKSESYDDRNDMKMKIKKSFSGRNFNGLITWSKLKSLKLDFLTNVSPSPWLLQLGCGRQWNSGLSDNRLMRHCSLKNRHCWPENQHCWCENGGISPKFVSPPATLLKHHLVKQICLISKIVCLSLGPTRVVTKVACHLPTKTMWKWA